jgi:hypothetical protein
MPISTMKDSRSFLVDRLADPVDLEIGGIRIGIGVRPLLAYRLRRKYGAFVRPSCRRPEAARLRIEAFLPEAPVDPDRPAMLPRVRLEEGQEGRVWLRGDCSAWLDPAAGYGLVAGGDGLSGVDALVRLSLSLLAPEEGWILLHGAAVQLVSGGWALLLGRSGAGKSTAARAFDSYCDEMVLARQGRNGTEAASTPYWNGRPGSGRCEAIVCLERSESSGSRLLRGGEAVRCIHLHLVRHLRREAADRVLFERLLELVREVPVVHARFRTGPSYPDRLEAEMEDHGFAPRRRVAAGNEAAAGADAARGAAVLRQEGWR